MDKAKWVKMSITGWTNFLNDLLGKQKYNVQHDMARRPILKWKVSKCMQSQSTANSNNT